MGGKEAREKSVDGTPRRNCIARLKAREGGNIEPDCFGL